MILDLGCLKTGLFDPKSLSRIWTCICYYLITKIAAHYLNDEKQTRILLFRKTHGILCNLAMPLNDLHYNGNGRYYNVRVEIDNSRHPALMQRRYHNKSTDYSIVFSPKEQNHYHRNGNAHLELLLLSFDHMSLQIPP